MIRPSSPPTALRCGRPARGLCGAAGRDRSRLVEAVRRDIDRAYRGELGLLFREIFTEEGTTLIPITDRYRSETDVRDCNLIDLYIRSKAALDIRYCSWEDASRKSTASEIGSGRSAFDEPDKRIARIRLSDKISRLHPRHVVPKPRQAYETEVPVRHVTPPARLPSRRSRQS
jgi:hypothetical protein